MSTRAKNVIQYVVPTMLSSICFFLFSVIDGIFVGRGVGTNALGAVNLAFPYIMLISAITMTVNIGGVSMFAIYIGKGEPEKANGVFRNSMIFLSAASVVLCFVGTVLVEPLCTLLGAGESYHDYCVDYLFWYSAFVIPSSISMGLQSYCRNDSDPGLVTLTVVLTTALNIFLDWLLIFPIPMGTKGAAIATGVSQSAGLLIISVHFLRKKGILRFGRVKPDGRMWKEIVIHGLPEGISQLSTPVMTLCMNRMLVQMLGDVGVNAFSVISYVASFTVAVFIGTSEGLQPLFGRSYGARQERDLKFYFRTGLYINFFGSLVVTGIILLLSRSICTLFGADEQTLEYALRVMPVYSVGFIINSFNVMITSYLYSTERSKLSTVISFLRSLVVNTVVILTLPRIFGPDSIWVTFAVYEAIVLAVAVVLLRYSERNGIVYR